MRTGIRHNYIPLLNSRLLLQKHYYNIIRISSQERVKVTEYISSSPLSNTLSPYEFRLTQRRWDRTTAELLSQIGLAPKYLLICSTWDDGTEISIFVSACLISPTLLFAALAASAVCDIRGGGSRFP